MIQLHISQPSLCVWDESNLIMVYYTFNMLLGSVCCDFVEEFYTYIHQRYWLLIFFGSVFIWFWYDRWQEYMKEKRQLLQ